MRRVTSEFAGAPASLVKRVRRLLAESPRRPYFVWVWLGETFEANRDALIASGQADPSWEFAEVSWDYGQDDPQIAPAPAEPTGV